MALSARSHYRLSQTASWEEIWEAGPYYDRLSELLEDARHYAIFTGWQIDSRLPLLRPFRPGALTPPGSHETLREKVLRICESKPGFHFYFLIWDHSYLYLPERELWQGRVWDEVHPRVHFIFDNRHVFGGAHHEKICIFDGKTALCGGIDLCGDRWDGPEHLFFDPRRSLNWREDRHGPYHDLAVQVSGPVCEELQRHLKARWEALSSLPFPEPPSFGQVAAHPENGHSVYVSRTLAESATAGQNRRIVREIEFLFRELIGAARKSLLLEGQYFWSRMITENLVAKMHAMRGRPFEITLILAELESSPSFTRKMAPYEMLLLEQLREAAEASGTALVMGTPYSHPPSSSSRLPPKPIYIHSKLMIVDDRYLSVGSANLASRALRIDTELNLTLEARSHAERLHIRRVREHVLSHWGLRPRSPTHLSLHGFRPHHSLRNRSPRLPFWRFFDPELPVGYLFKRRFRSLLDRGPRALPAAILIAVWGVASFAVILLSGAESGLQRAYAALLAAAWFLPIPPVPFSILGSVQLGTEFGERALVASIWSCSLVSYLGARTLPREFQKLLELSLGERRAREQASRLRLRLGRRSFSSLIGVLADPRIEFRTKTTYQGLCFTPLPWLALGCWVVWPAACALAVRAVVLRLPEGWIAPMRAHPEAVLAALVLFFAILRLCAPLFYGKESVVPNVPPTQA